MKKTLCALLMASAVGLIGCGNGTYIGPREISSEHHTENAVVIRKWHQNKQYLDPTYSLDPTTSLRPDRIAIANDEDEITIKYSKGEAVVDNKNLFDRVETNSEVKVTFAQSYDTIVDVEGKVLERKPAGYQIIDVSPNR